MTALSLVHASLGKRQRVASLGNCFQAMDHARVEHRHPARLVVLGLGGVAALLGGRFGQTDGQGMIGLAQMGVAVQNDNLHGAVQMDAYRRVRGQVAVAARFCRKWARTRSSRVLSMSVSEWLEL
jgi:hypothetical protein